MRNGTPSIFSVLCLLIARCASTPSNSIPVEPAPQPPKEIADGSLDLIPVLFTLSCNGPVEEFRIERIVRAPR